MADEPAGGGEAAGRAAGGESEEPPQIDVVELRRRAWEGVGVERDGAGLTGLSAWLSALLDPAAAAPATRAAAEGRNLAAVALAMARSAQFREESRGSHYRADFPERDERRFAGHTILDPQGLRVVGVDAPAGGGA
jgi:aspartate oxidase